jgi:hypothetical protein
MLCWHVTYIRLCTYILRMNIHCTYIHRAQGGVPAIQNLLHVGARKQVGSIGSRAETSLPRPRPTACVRQVCTRPIRRCEAKTEAPAESCSYATTLNKHKNSSCLSMATESWESHNTKELCVCLLLQYLLQSCSRWGWGIVEDMCYESRYTKEPWPVLEGLRRLAALWAHPYFTSLRLRKNHSQNFLGKISKPWHDKGLLGSPYSQHGIL